jgi:hypothetical protein
MESEFPRFPVSFFDTPGAAVACNFKAGSATLARAIIQAHHPTLEQTLHMRPGTGNGVAYPPGKGPDDLRWHGLCPKVLPQDRPRTVMTFRDPIARFVSACVECRRADIDEVLRRLESGEEFNIHFAPQSRLLIGREVLVYRFPEHFGDLAEFLGLRQPLPNIRGPRTVRAPELSGEQCQRLRLIYARDFEVLEGIDIAGRRVEPVAETAPDQAEMHRRWMEERNSLKKLDNLRVSP